MRKKPLRLLAHGVVNTWSTQLIVDSIISVSKEELSREQWAKMFRRLTYVDSDEIEVSAYDYGGGVVRLPRGTWDMLSDLPVEDRRSCPPMPKLSYVKQLDAPGYAGQSAALKVMYEREQGQVIAPPGRGKTEIGLAFAASCKTRTLVIVHTNALLKQWVSRAEESVPGMKVGIIQGHTCQVEHLTVAMAQTLKRHILDGGKFWRQFGCVIVDEAHHAAAETWEWLLNVCPAKYRFGITASEKRSDGRHPSVRFNIGPVIYKLKFESAVPMVVRPVETRWRTTTPPQFWAQMMRKLINDEERNEIIARLIDREVAEGNYTLCLSRQIKHLQNIGDKLTSTEGVVLITGRQSRRMQAQGIKALRDGDIHCILGTQMFEEGVDIPRINRVILAYPGTEITVLQKIGRGSRQAEGKTETIIYDLVDEFVPSLARQFSDRRSWYKRNGVPLGKVVKYAEATGKEERKAVIRNVQDAATWLKSLKVAR